VDSLLVGDAPSVSQPIRHIEVARTSKVSAVSSAWSMRSILKVRTWLLTLSWPIT